MVAWQPIGISMGVFDICHRWESPYHIYFQFIQLDMFKIYTISFSFAEQVFERKETIWSPTGGLSTQPREACPNAWQHSGHASRWLATMQTVRDRQNDARPCQFRKG
jgi:hypothetical protein